MLLASHRSDSSYPGFAPDRLATLNQPSRRSASSSWGHQVSRAPFAFNPHAASFIPAGIEQNVTGEHRTTAESALAITSMPEEVLALILQNLHSAKDLACVSSTCTLFRRLAFTARSSVRLSESLRADEDQFQQAKLPTSSHRSAAACYALPTTVERHLGCILVSLPGIAHLDVSNTLCLDEHISLALSTLKHLQTLKANNCRKITSNIGTVIFDHPSASLQQLCLQRCFQLTPATLVQGLQHAKRPDSRVQTLTLSHLDLREFVQYLSAATCGPAAKAAFVGTGDTHASATSRAFPTTSLTAACTHVESSLRVVALHCCEGLSPVLFSAIATHAPQLHALFLGGSTVSGRACMQSMHTSASSSSPVMQSSPGGASPMQWGDCGLSGPGRVPNEVRFDEVLAFVRRVREEAVSEAAETLEKDSGNESASVCRVTGVNGRVRRSMPRHGATASLALLLTSRLAATSAASKGNATKPAALGHIALATLGDSGMAGAAVLMHAALMFSQLQVLEITHMPLGVASLVKRCLSRAAQQCIGSMSNAVQPLPKPSQLRVWDLCTLPDATAATAAHNSSPCLSLAVRAAAASSVSSRHTALHCAAATGDAALARTLLHLGAAVDCRSKSGATPLFTACEGGHLGVAEALLTAGADMWVPTASLENCMYISALRGHSELVQLLLERCHAEGVAWEDPARYGDAWTPLMCCVVGDRVALAETLLFAAGSRAPTLLRARNRHGQTALHLAALRGASEMIKVLMRCGGEKGGDWGCGMARARDSAGLTPAQVARKHSQRAAEALLLRCGRSV